MGREQRAVVAPLALALAVLSVWWLATAAHTVPVFMLPGPGAVASALGRLLLDATFWPYAGQTAAEALGGGVLGVAVGVPLGIALHHSRWLSAAVGPYLGASQAIPAIALAPLLVLWVGYGLVGVMVLCALMVFFPVVIGASVGLRHVDRHLVEAARIDGATGLRRLWEIELPLALPQLLAGVRNGVALAVTGAVVGEMVMGGRGLGMLLTVQRDAVDTAGMMATIAILCALASAAYLLTRAVEQRALRHASLPTNDTTERH